MPNVNPPADAGHAERDPELRHRTGPGGAEVRISPRFEASTLPQRCGYRYAIVRDAQGRRYAGYLWEIPEQAGQPLGEVDADP